LLLWLTPLVVLGAGAAVLAVQLRRRPPRSPEKLSAEEEQQLARIMQAQD
jgi:cytochrome c-type biogenesis protein CcmH/NrfF